MVVTTFLLSIVMLRIWKWRLPIVASASPHCSPSSMSASSSPTAVKIVEGGWVSILFASIVRACHGNMGARHALPLRQNTQQTRGVRWEFLAEQMAKKARR